LELLTLAGTGAIRSTANDMLTFLEAFLAYKDSPLASAMRPCSRSGVVSNSPSMQIGLAWLVLSAPGKDDLVRHNSGTGGYCTLIGFDVKTRTGVVVLANTSTPLEVDDIGLHLLKPRCASRRSLPGFSAYGVHVDPKVFDNLTGALSARANLQHCCHPRGRPSLRATHRTSESGIVCRVGEAVFP
jgi:D-alanyl-D-alanine-carboxypeptidase/D-alanyl-D-alanine-endopeptidase